MIQNPSLAALAPPVVVSYSKSARDCGAPDSLGKTNVKINTTNSKGSKFYTIYFPSLCEAKATIVFVFVSLTL